MLDVFTPMDRLVLPCARRSALFQYAETSYTDLCFRARGWKWVMFLWYNNTNAVPYSE